MKFTHNYPKKISSGYTVFAVQVTSALAIIGKDLLRYWKEEADKWTTVIAIPVATGRSNLPSFRHLRKTRTGLKIKWRFRALQEVESSFLPTR